MSQKQFRFGESPHSEWDFSLSPEMGYFFLFLIICVFIVIFCMVIAELYFKEDIEKNEKPVPKKREAVKDFQGSPIEMLHAKMLCILQQRKAVKIQKWKTNSDYTVEINDPTFSQVCALYDSAVYGRQKIDDHSVTKLRKQFESTEVGQ